MHSPASQRRHVLYSGRVQGVGFRYTTAQIAKRFAVTGYVQNLQDGRVDLVVEGDEHEVAAFLNEVAERMSDCIRSTAVDRQAASGEFAGFTIRH